MPIPRMFPLTADMLSKIRERIKLHVEVYMSDEVYLDAIGAEPGGRALVESLSWPVKDAFEYFQKMGVGKLEDGIFTVFDRNYFAVDPNRIGVPVSFSLINESRAIC